MNKEQRKFKQVMKRRARRHRIELQQKAIKRMKRGARRVQRRPSMVRRLSEMVKAATAPSVTVNPTSTATFSHRSVAH